MTQHWYPYPRWAPDCILHPFHLLFSTVQPLLQILKLYIFFLEGCEVPVISKLTWCDSNGCLCGMTIQGSKGFVICFAMTAGHHRIHQYTSVALIVDANTSPLMLTTGSAILSVVLTCPFKHVNIPLRSWAILMYLGFGCPGEILEESMVEMVLTIS